MSAREGAAPGQAAYEAGPLGWTGKGIWPPVPWDQLDPEDRKWWSAVGFAERAAMPRHPDGYPALAAEILDAFTTPTAAVVGGGMIREWRKRITAAAAAQPGDLHDLAAEVIRAYAAQVQYDETERDRKRLEDWRARLAAAAQPAPGLAAAWEAQAVKCDEAAALPGLAKAAVLEQATFAAQLRDCARQLREAQPAPGDLRDLAAEAIAAYEASISYDETPHDRSRIAGWRARLAAAAQPAPEDLGRVAYEAHAVMLVPHPWRWDQLDDKLRAAWEAAAQAAIAASGAVLTYSDCQQPAPGPSDSQLFQLAEARDVLATWDLNSPGGISRETVLADQVRTLLAIIDSEQQPAPGTAPGEALQRTCRQAAEAERDRVRACVTALADELYQSAAATAPSKKSAIEEAVAAKLRQLLEEP